MRKLAILGSTGSIGRQALDVIASLPDELKAVCLSSRRNFNLIENQVRRFRPMAVAILDRCAAAALKDKVADLEVEVFSGEEGLSELVRIPEVDMVLNALVGAAGLMPTIEALEAGKHVALANKETLVVAGGIVMARAKERGVDILPVDSEHSAIFQCLLGQDRGSVKRIILTASGGPFREYAAGRLAYVTPREALAHPSWTMGQKITVDSATLMNKGLEIIEATWLFGVDVSRVSVVIHPECIVHSMVEFEDGAIMAELAVADMRLPIQYALTYPRRHRTLVEGLDLVKTGSLTFLEPDTKRFPCLALGYEAARTRGTMPAVLNAANEEAVSLFLAGEIKFTEIPVFIESAMEGHKVVRSPKLEDVLEADRWARAKVQDRFRRKVGGVN